MKVGKKLTFDEYREIKNLEDTEVTRELYKTYLKNFSNKGKTVDEMFKDGSLPPACFG